MSERPSFRHIHLDLVGGLAGDMFNAAVLDAWPKLESVAIDAEHASEVPPGWHVDHGRRVTQGIEARTFKVRRPTGEGPKPHHHGHHHSHDVKGQEGGHSDADVAAQHSHPTGRYADIRTRIEGMALTHGAKHHAHGIFHKLAVVEAQIHAIAIEDVHFHELADWDSVLDIVTAGALIDALEAASWSISPVPMGSGMVNTAHGPLPVPAPATAKLLNGFPVRDDGIPGERVTPTGAAILAWLQPEYGRAGMAGLLETTGMGAGMREMNGLANIVRLQAFSVTPTTATTRVGRDRVGVVEFDIDDQSAEELALTVEQLRAADGTIDVIVRTSMGKKQRPVFEVRLLTQPGSVEPLAERCLSLSSSLGVRVSQQERRKIQRHSVTVDLEGRPIDVKVAMRPDGRMTAKAESDQLEALSANVHERRELARKAETFALENVRTRQPDEL